MRCEVKGVHLGSRLVTPETTAHQDTGLQPGLQRQNESTHLCAGKTVVAQTGSLDLGAVLQKIHGPERILDELNRHFATGVGTDAFDPTLEGPFVDGVKNGASGTKQKLEVLRRQAGLTGAQGIS